MVNSLSGHFVRRWRERVGSEPSLDTVREMCAGGQVLKRGEKLYREVSGHLVPFRTVTMCWIPSRGLIIWIDPESARAITVIVAKDERNGVA